ncbi:MAG: glycosyltransferase [Rhizobiales bacterium]|nr:glycosyltransferase [Hyphomicrobiales bacterium]
MLSVVVATNESERALVPTLAALVPGATAGLVREVIIADPGSRDATADVADVAGCRMLVSDAPLGIRLTQAAAAARAPWLLFLTAGAVPQSGWVEEATRFIEEASLQGRADAVAAAFRAVSPAVVPASPLREAIALLAQAAGLVRHATQGLLIEKQHYLRIGGHRAEAPAPEADVLRRLGRRRIVTLRCGAVSA